MPENTGALQESSKFKKGQSGNPKGKPKGARNKSTLAAEELLEGSLVDPEKLKKTTFFEFFASLNLFEGMICSKKMEKMPFKPFFKSFLPNF